MSVQPKPTQRTMRTECILDTICSRVRTANRAPIPKRVKSICTEPAHVECHKQIADAIEGQVGEGYGHLLFRISTENKTAFGLAALGCKFEGHSLSGAILRTSSRL